MILNRADARWNFRRLDDDGLPAPQPSAHKRASHDSSDAAQNKRAVNRQSRFADIALREERAEFKRELRPQFLDTGPTCDRCPNECRVPEWRIVKLSADPFLSRICRLNEINFREGDDDSPHP